MKKCTKCKIEKELYKFNIDKNRKDGYYPSCKDCKSCINKKHYTKNIQKESKRKRIQYSNNRSTMLARSKKYNNKNISRRRASRAKYRAAKLNATPKWLTKTHLEEIQAFYTLAKDLEEQDGIKRHIDHIVPLQGKIVSGLHVPWNLQILTAEENMNKGNSFLKKGHTDQHSPDIR